MTNNVIESLLIKHSLFNKALVKLQQCMDSAEQKSEPMCLPIFGESRTGKSRLLEEFLGQYPRYHTETGLKIPILYVKTPSKPTVKGLAELLLSAMGEPLFDKGTEQVKTNRVKILIKNLNVKMLMIDEFQHFYDKVSQKVTHHVADWLKVLVDDTRISLVVAGIPECSAILSANEQLEGRFLADIQMPRFDWDNADQRAEFFGILQAFDDLLRSEGYDFPVFTAPEMAFRMYLATGGLMGYLTKFLKQVLANALVENRSIITLKHFEEGLNDAVRLKGQINPFSSVNMSAIGSAKSLAAAKLIGLRVEPGQLLKPQKPLKISK